MFDYLQQFNSLSPELRNKISSPSAMASLGELENKYRVDLAVIVMKVMVKTLAIKNLPAFFISEFALTPEASENLTKELKEKIFAPVADYLGLASELRALDLDQDISSLISEAGLSLSSGFLITRFKNILATYIKGVRSKIDARSALAKEASLGGLNLSPEEIDRIFRVCDRRKFSNLEFNSTVVNPPASRLDKIIAGADNVPAAKTGAEEYSLKQAIVSGQIKKPAGLDTEHELPPAEKQLNLPIETPIAPPAIKKIEKIAPPMILAAPVTLPPKIPSVSGQTSKPAASDKITPAAALKTPVLAPIITPPVPPISIIKPPVKVSTPPAVPDRPATPIKPLSPKTAANRPSPAPTARPVMHDIRPMPKVMGPIEELQFLDLVNFRRLGKTPPEITAKIFNKIKLLENDGYDKMIAGVKAWRQSPVSRLYLRLGQEAAASGEFLKDLIAKKQKENKESLSLEEIEAIVGLNSRLVF